MNSPSGLLFAASEIVEWKDKTFKTEGGVLGYTFDKRRDVCQSGKRKNPGSACY